MEVAEWQSVRTTQWAGIPSWAPAWPICFLWSPVLGGQKEPAGRTRWRWSPLPPGPQSCIQIHGQIEAGPWEGALASWPRQGTSWPRPCFAQTWAGWALPVAQHSARRQTPHPGAAAAAACFLALTLHDPKLRASST